MKITYIIIKAILYKLGSTLVDLSRWLRSKPFLLDPLRKGPRFESVVTLVSSKESSEA